MAIVNGYDAYVINPDILSEYNVDQSGEVVSAEVWKALWDLVLGALIKYDRAFIDIYRTLTDLNTELDHCIQHVDRIEEIYDALAERMETLEKTWTELQATYNKIAGHYEDIKDIHDALKEGLVHYGVDAPTLKYTKLWVVPTQLPFSPLHDIVNDVINSKHYVTEDYVNNKLALYGESIRAEILPILNTVQGENNVTEVNVWELETGIYRIIGSFNYMQGKEFIPYETIGGVGFATTGVLIVAKNDWDVSWVFIGVTAIKGYQYYRGEVKVDGSNGSYTKILQSGGGAEGEDGVSITSVEQTTTSTEDNGNNVITVTLSDGTTSTFTVKNGSKGSRGEFAVVDTELDENSENPVSNKTIWWYITVLDEAISELRGSIVENATSILYRENTSNRVQTIDENSHGLQYPSAMAVYNYVEGIKPDFVAKNQGSANVGKILVVGSDGNLTLADMPEGGASGDVIGTLDESNNILLSGNLADGTYTLKYENEDGTYTDVGTFEVGAIPDTPDEPTPTIINLATPNETATGQTAWESGGWCNASYMAGSSYAYRAATDGRITTNTIAVEYGDTIYIKGIKYSEGSTAQLAIFGADGSYIKHASVYNMANSQNYIDDLTATDGNDYWHFINRLGSDGTDNGARFIRLAGIPSGSINDIIITRNQPIV